MLLDYFLKTCKKPIKFNRVLEDFCLSEAQLHHAISFVGLKVITREMKSGLVRYIVNN